MFKTTKGLFGLAGVSGLLAAAFYWWWGRLIVGTFSQCVAGTAAAGIDCTHSPQIYTAVAFAVLAAILFLAAVVRWISGRKPTGRVA